MNPLDVAIEALSCVSVHRATALREHLAKKDVVVPSAALVGPHVQIQAQHGPGRRRKSRQPVELGAQWRSCRNRRLRHTTAVASGVPGSNAEGSVGLRLCRRPAKTIAQCTPETNISWKVVRQDDVNF